MFLIGASAQGRRFGSAGALGWAAPVPEKLTSVFIITAQGRSSKKRGWLRAFLIGAAAQGRRFGSPRALGWAAPVPRAKVKIEAAAGRKISFRSCRRSSRPGAQGRSREAPALFQLIPAFCKPHFFQVCYVPAGLLSRNGCKVSAGFHV